ncbi:MAG TPA: acyl-CoA thioesterase [Desulfobulbus sp.]|nr:acyl-CoA thioesterase [Desulfobulbus sp.]
MDKIIFTENIHTFHIDFAGHVSNITYIQWMEIGRLKLLEAIGLPVTGIIDELGLLPTLVKTEIKYRKQLFLGDQVRVEMWLSRLRNVSADMNFLFFNSSGVLTAEGRQTALFIDRDTHRPTPLTNKAHAGFKRYLAG